MEAGSDLPGGERSRTLVGAVSEKQGSAPPLSKSRPCAGQADSGVKTTRWELLEGARSARTIDASGSAPLAPGGCRTLPSDQRVQAQQVNLSLGPNTAFGVHLAMLQATHTALEPVLSATSPLFISLGLPEQRTQLTHWRPAWQSALAKPCRRRRAPPVPAAPTPPAHATAAR